MRRVVGVTIDVRSIDTAAAHLASARVAFRRLTSRTGRRSLVVDPDVAYGIWLELREQEQ